MKKCLRITFVAELPKNFLHDTIQKHAHKLNIEGTGQLVSSENKIKIMACGEKEDIDSFLDFLHKEATQAEGEDFEVEPFLREKDYRGVFRIIE